jgi:hypothetical protein
MMACTSVTSPATKLPLAWPLQRPPEAAEAPTRALYRPCPWMYGCDMSSFIPRGEHGIGNDDQERAQELETDPQQVANIEAAQELNRERWHDRLAKLFGRRRPDNDPPS